MKKSVTLTELLIVVIILGILATFAVPIYNNVIENAKAKACETNQKVLLGAVEQYGLEHDAFPGSLSKLEEKHLKKAWAKLLEKEGSWKIKLAYFLADLNNRGLAYAQDSWTDRYIGDTKYFQCPSDIPGAPYSEVNVSYGINPALASLTFQQYETVFLEGTATIADSDSPALSGEDGTGNIAQRHKRYGVASFSGDDYGIYLDKTHTVYYFGKD